MGLDTILFLLFCIKKRVFFSHILVFSNKQTQLTNVVDNFQMFFLLTQLLGEWWSEKLFDMGGRIYHSIS